MQRKQQLSTVCRLFILLVFNNSVSNKVDAIIRGDSTEPGQFPYHVGIMFGGKYRCGGGIINEKFIVTAAHCVTDHQSNFIDKQIQVMAGSVDFNDIDDWRRADVDVEKVYVLNDYKNGEQHDDIAVLRLRTSLPMQAGYLQKLNLPWQKDKFAGATATVAGFGCDEITFTFGGGSRIKEDCTKSGLLSWTEVKILSKRDCWNRKLYYVHDTHLCGRMIKPGLLPYGICAGDSGSPLVYRAPDNAPFIIGVAIVSPLTCNEAYQPAVYTRITSFLHFITNAMNDRIVDMKTKTYENQSQIEIVIVPLHQ